KQASEVSRRASRKTCERGCFPHISPLIPTPIIIEIWIDSMKKYLKNANQLYLSLHKAIIQKPDL
ncbi:MAG: hypothetical protein PHQ11_06530, partial [Paludibacter sp.]|nr:hypothetical protein [Paludibacter sp.]